MKLEKAHTMPQGLPTIVDINNDDSMHSEQLMHNNVNINASNQQNTNHNPPLSNGL